MPERLSALCSPAFAAPVREVVLFEVVPPASGAQYVLSAGRHRAVVVEVGGGVRTYDHAGVPVLAGYPEDAICPRAAGAVLAPWPNRLADGGYVHEGQTYQLARSEPANDNAIHGLVRWVHWTATEVHTDRVTFSYDLPPQPGYPFTLRLRTRWSVGPGGLRAEHQATNLGAGTAPFGFGAHPYLDVAGTPLSRVRVQVPASTRLHLDRRMLPVAEEPVRETPYDLRRGRRLGALRLDTAYTGLRRGPDGTARVRVSTAVRGAEVWMDEAFDWVQLFTPESTVSPVSTTGTDDGDSAPTGPEAPASTPPTALLGGAAVAVEPMTCAPDAFNSGRGLLTLAPGERWQGTWGVRPLVG